MRTSFRRRWWIVTLFSAVLILAASVFAGKQLGASQQATLDQARSDAAIAAVASLRATAFASCYRSNQQRRAINKSTAATYRAFYLNGSLELAASKVGKDKKRKSIERISSRSILDAANALQYLPLTDCAQSISHPATYKLAAPLPYVKYLKLKYHHKP